ncbi:MAG: hypothetical protein QGG74_00830 [Phycisphaerales bacterium]|nr:hypothetical protein [Phycisphaerales bacterium]
MAFPASVLASLLIAAGFGCGSAMMGHVAAAGLRGHAASQLAKGAITATQAANAAQLATLADLASTHQRGLEVARAGRSQVTVHQPQPVRTPAGSRPTPVAPSQPSLVFHHDGFKYDMRSATQSDGRFGPVICTDDRGSRVELNVLGDANVPWQEWSVQNLTWSGVSVEADGQRFEGRGESHLAHGRCVVTGLGRIRYPDGRVYLGSVGKSYPESGSGRFVPLVPQGDGCMTVAAGARRCGQWKDGVLLIADADESDVPDADAEAPVVVQDTPAKAPAVPSGSPIYEPWKPRQ